MAEILNKGREVEDLILEGTTWCTIDWMGKINIERLESRTLLTIDWGLTPIDETNYSWTNSVVHTPIIGQTSPVEVKIHNNQNDHNVDRQVVVSFEANFLGYLIDFHPKASVLRIRVAYAWDNGGWTQAGQWDEDGLHFEVSGRARNNTDPMAGSGFSTETFIVGSALAASLVIRANGTMAYHNGFRGNGTPREPSNRLPRRSQREFIGPRGRVEHQRRRRGRRCAGSWHRHRHRSGTRRW